MAEFFKEYTNSAGERCVDTPEGTVTLNDLGEAVKGSAEAIKAYNDHISEVMAEESASVKQQLHDEGQA